MSSHLCLPSPAIVKGGWVGKRVGREGKVIDKFADSVMNCHDIYADTWRNRHDRIKEHVVSEAIHSGVYVDCEVYGQFSDLLPASVTEEGGELQWGRARQGCVPDFKFLINTPAGPESSLAELKVLNCGQSRYPRGVIGKGTNRKLWKYDVKFHYTPEKIVGQPEPSAGPLVSRLGSNPMMKLVAGP